MDPKEQILIYPPSMQVDAGSHMILIYKDVSHLIEFLGNYFYEGLRNGEVCIMINEVGVFAKVKEEILKKDGMNEAQLKDGFIFVNFKEFYLEDGTFNASRTFEKIDEIFAKYAGRKLRITGDGSWIDKTKFDVFHAYEIEMTKKYSGKDVVIVCSYLSARLEIEQTIDLIQAHMLIIFKEEDKWKISETVERGIYEQKITELKQFNKMAIGRELKMVQLKEKIEQLEHELADKNNSAA